MYKVITGIAVIAIVIIIVAAYIYQSPEYTTIQEEERAVFLAERALEEYYSKGVDSFKIISNDPKFHDENVYVFVIDESTEIIMAHSIDDSLIGSDVSNLVDIDGENIGDSIMQDATSKGVWIEYKLELDDGEIVYKKLWAKSFEGHVFGAVDNY